MHPSCRSNASFFRIGGKKVATKVRSRPNFLVPFVNVRNLTQNLTRSICSLFYWLTKKSERKKTFKPVSHFFSLTSRMDINSTWLPCMDELRLHASPKPLLNHLRKCNLHRSKLHLFVSRGKSFVKRKGL